MLKIYICLLLFVTGACIGSFINVVIYRLQKGNFLKEKHSYCPECGEKLKNRDLIPVISYVLLKGKCRYCGKKISRRYPEIEIAGALLAVLCYLRYGIDFKALVSYGAVIILLAVAMIDHDSMEIPDSLVIALIPFAAGAVWCWTNISLIDRLIGFAAVSVPMLVLALIINGAFGGGDIKLMAVCGFLLGWKNVLLAFFIALLFGGGYAVYLMKKEKKERGAQMAFGPYLCLGSAVALLWGTEIMNFYLNIFI